jgi:hypothetical protein
MGHKQNTSGQHSEQNILKQNVSGQKVSVTKCIGTTDTATKPIGYKMYPQQNMSATERIGYKPYRGTNEPTAINLKQFLT